MSKQEKRPLNTKYTIKKLWSYLKPNKTTIVVVVILTLLSNLLALVGPVLTGMAIDAMGLGKDNVNFEKLAIAIILMLIFYIISGIFSWLQSHLMVNVTQQAIFNIRKDLFNKITALPITFFDKHKKGDIISRMSYDIDVMSTSISTDVLQMFTSFVMVVGSFIMMLLISTELILIFIVVIPITIIFTRNMTRFTKKLFRLRQKKIGELNDHIEEMLTGNNVVKAYNQEDVVLEQFRNINHESTEASYKAQYYSSLIMPSLNFINNLSFLLVTVVGAFLVASNRLTVGNISSFILYSKKFAGPINESANIINEIQSAFAAAERVFNTIDQAQEFEENEAINLDNPRGEVVFNNVSFGYYPDKTIINNLNLSINPGSLIAIVGPTGAGKTTIVNLLMKFYQLNSGQIEVDGIDIAKITNVSLRKSFAMVLQETWLFTGTISENIAYGSPNTSLDDVINAAKQAKAHSFIKRLPNGYDTIIAEDGGNLSLGQKQLITIARAMLQNPTMLILDEATSSVDTRTEIKIQKAMNELMKNKTSFVIAHRLSTIRDADLILVVNNGEIFEKGTHQELLELNGLYAKLHNSQFETTI